MKIIEKNGRKVKTHIRYKNLKGENVPGVTTVLGILNKPALGFEIRKVNNINKYFEIFEYCLSIYNLKKEIKEVKENE